MTYRRDQQAVRRGWRVFAAAMVLGLTICARALQGTAIQDAPTATTGDETAKAGEDTTVKVCTECHEFDQVVALRRTPREWKDMVTTMANKGATGSPEE